ncbi:MAG: hypothetical protein K6G23_01550 [Lachnospiraceae bacterium]|nr:hypothetical protein [Lachnospiraceae bacterium]
MISFAQEDGGDTEESVVSETETKEAEITEESTVAGETETVEGSETVVGSETVAGSETVETETEETEAEETEAEETETTENEVSLETNFFSFWDYFDLPQEEELEIPDGFTRIPGENGAEDTFRGPDGYLYTIADLKLLEEESYFDASWLFASLAVMNQTEGATQRFNYTGGVQKFEAPIAGIYHFELYGGKGGSLFESNGGNGGYTQGYLKMQRGDVVYLCVGGAGNNASGGYNGGGSGAFGDWGGGGLNRSCGGGGATSLTTTNRGVLKNFNSYRNEVLLVAAGGGGASYEATSQYYGDEKTANNGSAGGGLSTEGYEITGSSGERQPNSHYERSTIEGVNQTRGYAFGQGQSTGNTRGAGGGGWYGGTEQSYGGCLKGGGGGSSYIAGAPSFTFAGVTYASSTVGGRSGGQGYAVVSLSKILLDAQLPAEIHKIELQHIEVSAKVNGVETYVWEMQQAESKEALSEDAWVEMDFTTSDKYRLEENITDGRGTIAIHYDAEVEDDHTFFRMFVTGNETERYSDPCLVLVDPLKLDHLSVETPELTLELGDVISSHDFEVTVIYNNEDVTIDLWKDEQLKEQVYFVSEDGSLVTEYACDHLANGEVLTVHFEHEDAPRDVTVLVTIVDTTPPVLTLTETPGLNFSDHEVSQEITLHVELEDEAVEPVTYHVEDENGNTLDGPKTEGDLHFTLEGNTKVIIVAVDASGNELREEYPIDYVDTTPPAITHIGIDQSGWTKDAVTISVSASDDLSNFPKAPYSFDGGRTWQESPNFETHTNGVYTIVVRDLVGNETRRTFEISNIDTAGPAIHRISINPADKEWTSGSAIVCVEAEDSDSGLDEEPFSFDGGQSWEKSPFYELEDSATLSVCVRDRVGNVSQATFRATKQADPLTMPNLPFGDGLLSTEELLLIETAATQQERVNGRNQGGGKPVLVETVMENEIFGEDHLQERKTESTQPMIQPAGEIMVSGDQDLSIAARIWKFFRQNPTATAAGATAAGASIWGFFLFVYVRKAEVYRLNSKYLEEEYLGRFLIRKKRASYVIRMKMSKEELAGEILLIRLSKRFQKKADGKILTLQLKDVQRDVKIHPAKQFKISFRQTIDFSA